MPIEVFSIPAKGDPKASDALNRFLGNHRILSVERRMVEDGGQSYWTFLVDYVGVASAGNESAKKSAAGKVDYRELLEPNEFDRYLQLRALRKEIAEQKAVPHFTIFTNEQLAAMARLKKVSKVEMKGIPGIGEAKVSQYGDTFLNLLKQESKEVDSDETPGASDGTDCGTSQS
jgi:superfamily II DNA helicase RecQ